MVRIQWCGQSEHQTLLGWRVNEANGEFLNFVRVIAVQDAWDIVRRVRGNENKGNCENAKEDQCYLSRAKQSCEVR